MLAFCGFIFIGFCGYCFGHVFGRAEAWKEAEHRYRWNMPPFDHAANTDFRAYYEWKEKHNGGKDFGLE